MGRRSKSSKGKKAKQSTPSRPQPERRRDETPEQGMPPVDGTPLRWWWISALLIALAVVAIYQTTLENEFLTFDDRKYIYENEFIKENGTWKFKKMFMNLHYRSPIEGGWAVTPMIGAGRASQSDAPPTHFHPAPDIKPVPVHWQNPIT